MSDILRMDYINSLPQPFMARMAGGDSWPVYDIEVETGLIRLDICGLLQISSMGEVIEFTDIDGGKHTPDSFYVDYQATP